MEPNYDSHIAGDRLPEPKEPPCEHENYEFLGLTVESKRAQIGIDPRPPNKGE